MGKGTHRREPVDHSLITRPEIIRSTEGPAPSASRTRAKLDSTATGIAREKRHVESTRDGAAQVLVHLD
jgi:hypothetical protein